LSCPLTLFLIFLLLYLNTKVHRQDHADLLAVPFSAVAPSGCFYLLGYNIEHSGCGWADRLDGRGCGTAVFMLLYLDLAYEERCLAGRMHSLADLQEALYTAR